MSQPVGLSVCSSCMNCGVVIIIFSFVEDFFFVIYKPMCKCINVLYATLSYDGILTVNAILKIQCCWRGYKGRQIAAQKYMFFLTEKMEIIRGLCRCWKVSIDGCTCIGSKQRFLLCHKTAMPRILILSSCIGL